MNFSETKIQFNSNNNNANYVFYTKLMLSPLTVNLDNVTKRISCRLIAFITLASTININTVRFIDSLLPHFIPLSRKYRAHSLPRCV